jgi:phosphate acetyltransferase
MAPSSSSSSSPSSSSSHPSSSAAHPHYDRLIAVARALPPLRVAVVHPVNDVSLEAVLSSVRLGLIAPVLIGPRERIEAAAASIGADLSAFDIIDAPHSHAAANVAVAMALRGEVDALMKGSLHTDELMGAVVRREGGLRTSRRISHCFVMDVPGHSQPLIISDAAINIAPTLEEKVDIVQNAIDLAHALQIPMVRVALLSATETVNPKVPSTLDAAVLCKMADRGQITGAQLDGPLAMDNAIDPEAARIKGIVSPVAGRANVLIVPDLDAGNMLAKSLTFLGGAYAAGIVLGTKVPVILTSRADSESARLASCAVASMLAKAGRERLIKAVG